MKFRYYRIVQITKRNGDTVFMVQAATNLFAAILGFWHQFEQESHNMDHALYFLRQLHMNAPQKTKEVYTTTTTQLIIVNGK